MTFMDKLQANTKYLPDASRPLSGGPWVYTLTSSSAPTTPSKNILSICCLYCRLTMIHGCQRTLPHRDHYPIPLLTFGRWGTPQICQSNIGGAWKNGGGVKSTLANENYNSALLEADPAPLHRGWSLRRGGGGEREGGRWTFPWTGGWGSRPGFSTYAGFALPVLVVQIQETPLGLLWCSQV